MPESTWTVRTRIELQGEREYERELQRAERALEQTNQAQIASARKLAAEEQQALDQRRRGALAMTASFASIVTGIESAINIMSRLGQAFTATITRAADYSDVLAGHAVSIGQAQRATAGLIDAMTMHRNAARLEAAGIELTAEQYASLSQAALEYARSTGTDVVEAQQALTNAVVSGGRGLRQFGIQIQTTGTLQERQSRVLEQLQERWAGQAASIEDNDEALQALRNSWSTAWSEMAMTLDQEGSFIREILTGLTGFLNDITNALETQRRAQAGVQVGALLDQQVLVQQRRQALAERMRASGVRPEDVQVGAVRLGQDLGGPVPLSEAPASLRAGADLLEMSREQLALVTEYQGVLQENQRIEEQIAEVERRRNEQQQVANDDNDDNAARRQQDRFTEEEQAKALAALEQQELDRIEAARAQARDTLRTWWDEVEQRLNELHQAELDRIKTETMTRLDAIEQQRQAMLAALEDVYSEQAEKQRNASEAQDAFAEGVIGSIQDTVNQVKGLFDAIDGAIGAAMDNQLNRQLRQAEAMGASAEEQAAMVEANEQKKAKAKGIFLVAYNSVMALTETAAAIMAFAEQQYAEGIEHTLAAATFTAAAVMAGIQLGGGSSKAAAKPTSTFTAAPEAPSKDKGEDRGMSVYNIYSLGSSQEEMGRAMQLADWERRRGGRPPVGGLGIGYDA